MERGFILFVAALTVFVAPGVQGTAHLSFAVNATVNITRDGCGVTKLCVEVPADCDPAGNGTCLFGSVVATTPMAPNGTDLTIQLRGESTGYVALGLTVNASEGIPMLFVCAQNNNSFLFRTVETNSSNMLSPTERIVREIRGSVEGDVIRCEFEVPMVNATKMGSMNPTTLSIVMGTGTFNDSMIGPFNQTFNSGPLDVANPNATEPAPTTPAPTTPAPTTPAPTTPAPATPAPTTPGLTFSNATVDITRDGCGVTKLCVETPDDCDPAGSGSCLFGSVAAGTPTPPNGADLTIQLRGESTGYVALGLTSPDTTLLFICGQNAANSNAFFFRVATTNSTNSVPTTLQRTVRDIRSSVEGNVIRCEFVVPGINATNLRSSHVTTFSVVMGSGTVNGSEIGSFSQRFNSGPVNVADPTSTATATVSITRDGCAATKVCVETPASCDPAGNGTCLFGSVNASTPMPPNGTDLIIQVRGESTGYVALGLTVNASEDTTVLYICAQNASSNSVFSTVMMRNNSDNTLSASGRTVSGFRSSVENDTIRCEFGVSMVNATNLRDSHATTFVIILGNGTVNGDGSIGAFTARLTSDPVNVADPSSTATTAAPTTMTTAGASGLLHSQALLFLLSVFALKLIV